jgi:DNA primase
MEHQPTLNMEARRLSYAEAKQVSIVDYLTSSGIEPATVRGHDYWYHSPFREERTPSFKVNAHLNVWYDHGTGEGGTILDLGARLHQCTLPEFLEKLSSQNQHVVSLHRVAVPVRTPENKLEVISVSELTDPNLLHYLKTRGISESTSKMYCKELTNDQFIPGKFKRVKVEADKSKDTKSKSS